MHYNAQLHCAPQAGQDRTLDPISQPDGPEPYTYVAFNLLGNIYPEGWVLFAFDETCNSNDTSVPAMKGDKVNNAWKFG